jgi:hypothetical protein
MPNNSNMDAGISSNAREKNTEMAEFIRNKFLRVMKVSTHEVIFQDRKITSVEFTLAIVQQICMVSLIRTKKVIIIEQIQSESGSTNVLICNFILILNFIRQETS